MVVASPKGGNIPPGPSSVDAAKDDEEAQKFLREEQHLWENTLELESFKGKANEFDAIFFVGGHGRKFKCA